MMPVAQSDVDDTVGCLLHSLNKGKLPSAFPRWSSGGLPPPAPPRDLGGCRPPDTPHGPMGPQGPQRGHGAAMGPHGPPGAPEDCLGAVQPWSQTPREPLSPGALEPLRPLCRPLRSPERPLWPPEQLLWPPESPEREASEASWREAGGRPLEDEKLSFQKMSGIASLVSEAWGSLGEPWGNVPAPPWAPGGARGCPPRYPPPSPPPSLLSPGGSNRHGMPY